MQSEISRRRTFAIISHPDAGKTTLTEKFLLYGGAVQLAGSVTARKDQRATTSDWMELEKKRGISISSTVLQFDYNHYRINLLDTPGHKDFSEDTYRVLTAVDAVVMVIDAAKGIEPQTRKLFEICRRRGVPIFTFMNKCDRPTQDPLALLDELESVLGIGAYAMNYPLGTGPDFAGVYDRLGKHVHFFQRTAGNAYRAPVQVLDLNTPEVHEKLNDRAYQKTVDDLEMLDIASTTFDHEAVLAGRLTPVFFGSAINNFGVQLLLDAFLKYSTSPRPRSSARAHTAAHLGSASADGLSSSPLNPQPRTLNPSTIPTDHPSFSGFVFKIQANMDPRHRDRIAFLRVCSGKFQREMSVLHVQSGKTVRLNSSHKLFGRDRETIDEAYAGDVIGIVGHSDFGIGDTLTTDTAILYDEIPRFAPECFAYIHSEQTSQYKQFRQGLDQLLQEGVIQSFTVNDSTSRTPLLAAVGPLQFEVVQYRLKSEYGADTRLERAPWELLRWASPETPKDQLDSAILPSGARHATDPHNQPAILFTTEWSLKYFEKQNPQVKLADIPFRSLATTK